MNLTRAGHTESLKLTVFILWRWNKDRRWSCWYTLAENIIPTLHEVTTDVASRLTNNLHGNVVPWHTWNLCSVVHLLVRLVESIEVLDSRVAVVFAWPDLTVLGVSRALVVEFEASELVVCQGVAGVIPSTEAKIDTSNKRHHVVNNDNLLVMRPEELILPKLIR